MVRKSNTKQLTSFSFARFYPINNSAKTFDHLSLPLTKGSSIVFFRYYLEYKFKQTSFEKI